MILVCIYGIIGLPTSKDALMVNLRKNIRLGLDLKGGSHLVLQVQLQDAFKAEADSVIARLKDEARKAGIEYTDMTHNDPSSIQTADTIQIDVKGVPATKAANFRSLVNDNFGSEWILTPVNPTDYRMTMQPSAALKLKQDTLTQSMGTIERKINGLGLSESSVQGRGGSGPESEAEILVQLPGVDDPARIKQILQTTAQLELDAVVGGPFASREEAMSSKGGVLPLNSVILRSVARNGAPPEFWIVNRTPEVRGSDLRDSQPQQGDMGRWETSFVLTQDAAKRFAAYTGANVGNRLAIVLDKTVLSAPTIESKRISDTGRITGAASHEDAADLALNLPARARCRPVSNTWRNARLDLRSARIPSVGCRNGGRHRGRGCRRDRDAGVLQAQRNQRYTCADSKRHYSGCRVELLRRGADPARHCGLHPYDWYGCGFERTDL